MSFSIISAHDNNLGIGFNNTIPWHIPADFKWFKEKTMNKTVIMGLNTYFSLPRKNRPLPGRNNIVLCKDLDVKEIIEKEGATIYTSIDDILKDFNNPNEEYFIIGGQSLYNQFIDKVDTLYLTEIDKEFECDTWFPKINKNEWENIFMYEVHNKHKDGLNYTFNIYKKIK